MFAVTMEIMCTTPTSSGPPNRVITPKSTNIQGDVREEGESTDP